MVNVTDKSGSNNHKRPGNGSALGSPSKGETYSVDTSNILFILSGAFIGLEKIVTDRLSRGVSFDVGFKKMIITQYIVNWFWRLYQIRIRCRKREQKRFTPSRNSRPCQVWSHQ